MIEKILKALEENKEIEMWYDNGAYKGNGFIIKRNGKYTYCYRHEAYTEPIKSLGNRRIKVSECDNCVEIENIEKIKEIIEAWKNKNAEIRIKDK